jgi:hypothetical protein
MSGAPERLSANVVVHHRPEPDPVARLACAAVAAGAAGPQVIAAVRLHQGSARVAAGDGEESLEDVFESLRDFFLGTQVHEVGRSVRPMRWPLYLLSSPDVPGAQLTVTMTQERGRAGGWNLTLLGNGFMGTTTFTIIHGQRVVAAAGQRRLVFLEHQVEVVRNRLERPGRPPTHFEALEILEDTSAVGVLDLEPRPLTWCNPGRAIARLRYAEASPEGIQQWTYDQDDRLGSDLVFGLNQMPLMLGATLGYRIATHVNLNAALPGGTDWILRAPERCPGAIAREGG